MATKKSSKTTKTQPIKTPASIPPTAEPIAVLADDHQLTSHGLGELIQMDPSSVVKWVNDGKLKSYRTPGGHRRILVRDARAFLQEHGMFIPAKLGGAAA